MRKEKQLTRKQLALRWLAFLAFLIAWAVVPGRFRFLPDQAIREAERAGKIGSTQLIAELPGHEGRTLRGNSKGLMISLLENDWPSGWEAQYCVYLDCSKAAPFHAGIGDYYLWTDGGYEGFADWFGRIDDPSAAAVRLELYENDELTGTYTVEKEDWIRKNGFTYFALEFEKAGWSQYVRIQSTLLDAYGNELFSRKIEWDRIRQRSQYMTHQ